MTKESRELTLKRKRKLWGTHVEAWSESGMTQTEYCRQNDLSIKCFGYWKRKFKKNDTAVTFYPVPSNPMNILNNENLSFSLRLVVDDQFKIEIGNDFLATTLERLVQNYLQGYKGYVQTDGYAGYDFLDRLPDIHHVGCWAHARRKFIEVTRASGKKRGYERKQNNADEAINFIRALYKNRKRYSKA